MAYDEIPENSWGYLREVKLASFGQRWIAGAFDYVPLIVILIFMSNGVLLTLLGWLLVVLILLGTTSPFRGTRVSPSAR
jgi:uncharacterized RDD family membrane protein YckC